MLSDDEKKRRGTFDNRYSSETKGKVEAGKILAFPIMREIPACRFPLNKAGQETFDHWTRRLRDAKLLTETSFAQIETLALADHSIADAMAAGRAPAIRSLENRRQLFIWLESLNVSDSVISGERAKGTFASNGFPNKLKTPEEHRAWVVGEV